MRVIHCGGFGALTEALAASESDLGVTSEALGGTSSEAFWAFSAGGALADLAAVIKAKRPDILVVHGSLALGGAFGLNVVPSMDLLRELRAEGTCVVYWSQGTEPFASAAQRTKAKLSEALFRESVSHVLLSSLEAFELARMAQSYSWLAPPAPLALFEGAGAREYDRGHFRFSGLMVPFQLSPIAVTKVQEALLANKSPLTLQILPPEKVPSLSALHDALMAADLVIDAPDSSSYGPLGTLGLAAGRPLFSGISPLLKKEWPSQELCPAIGIDPSTIADKVRHILMEPRMLRDLGKRARAFALERHHPSRVAPLTLQLYQRLIG